MSKVKIKTSIGAFWGKCISIGDKDIEFDNLGCVEMEEAKAKELVKTHSDILIFADSERSPINSNLDKGDTKQYEKLASELTICKQKNEELKNSIKLLKEDNDAWKAEVDKYKKDSEAFEFDLSEYKSQSEKIQKELNLKIGLLGKTTKELVDFCIDLKISEDKYKSLSKEQIIDLIIEDSKK